MATIIKEDDEQVQLTGPVCLVPVPAARASSTEQQQAQTKQSLSAASGVMRQLGAIGDIARAATIATAPVAPFIASVIAVATVASHLPILGLEPVSFWAAVLDLLIGWAAIASVWALLGMTSVRRANTTTFCELSTQFKMLRAAGDMLKQTGLTNGANGTGVAPDCCALTQFDSYMEEINGALDGRRWGRTVWVLGTGYLSAWELIHRAHEALIEIEPMSRVVWRARYDRLRLDGAQMQHYEELGKQLDGVIKRFGPSTQSAAATNQDAQQEARTTVATVRETLNEFMDENRAGLVRSRIQLACTTMNTGLIAYGVLWLALAAGLRDVQLISAAAFFLVGAVVGLVSRLRADYDNDSTVDDFGLSAMRHFACPQLSGVAAVLGVGLLAVTGVSAHLPIATPGVKDPLTSAFDTVLSPTNLVTAAVFGLTPGLLIDRLRQQTDTLKKNLRSAGPHTRPTRTA